VPVKGKGDSSCKASRVIFRNAGDDGSEGEQRKSQLRLYPLPAISCKVVLERLAAALPPYFAIFTGIPIVPAAGITELVTVPSALCVAPWHTSVQELVARL